MAQGRTPQISIVIPCFNERAVLPMLYDRLTSAAEGWSESFEVVVVDDGSTDESWEILQEICRRDARWKGVRFARNFGHQAAVSAGIRYASGLAVITIDADLQDPPEVLHIFIEKWKEGYEVVYGVRRKRKEGPVKRTLYHGFYRILSLLADTNIPRDSGDFALIDRRVIDCLNAMPERNRFVRGLRAWVGFRQVGVQYERAARSAGEPKYTLGKLISLAKAGIFSFSTVPLGLLTKLGAMMSLLSFLAAAVYLVRRFLVEDPVPGFATIILVLLFLGGTQLMGLGLLGEYIGRIYEEVKQRPLWVVRDTQGIEDLSKPEISSQVNQVLGYLQPRSSDPSEV